MPGPEAKIERKAVERAERRGWWQTKIMKASINGVPDRIFIRAGRVVFIEFKASPALGPSPQQEKRIAELIEAGVEAYCVGSVEEADQILG